MKLYQWRTRKTEWYVEDDEGQAWAVPSRLQNGQGNWTGGWEDRLPYPVSYKVRPTSTDLTCLQTQVMAHKLGLPGLPEFSPSMWAALTDEAWKDYGQQRQAERAQEHTPTASEDTGAFKGPDLTPEQRKAVKQYAQECMEREDHWSEIGVKRL